MPKKYGEIVSEFEKYKQLDPGTNLDLADFAQAADESDPAGPQRHEAYNARGIIKGAKDVNEFINKAFEFTGAPEAGGLLGRGVGYLADKALGTNITPTLESVGEMLPRGIAESAATLATGPVGVGAWLARGAQAAGYGSAALQGVAQTDSLLGAPIGAGSLALSNMVTPKVTGKVFTGVQDFLKGAQHELPPVSTLTPTSEVLNAAQRATAFQQPLRMAAGAAGVGAGLASEGGINELTRQAQLSVGPNKVGPLDPERNPLTEQNIASQIGMSLAGAPQAIHGIIKAPHSNVTAVQGLTDWLNKREAFKQADLGILSSEVDGQTLRQLRADNYDDQKTTAQIVRSDRIKDLDLPPGVTDFSYYLDGQTLDQAVKNKKGDYPTLIKTQLDALAQARFEGRTEHADEIQRAVVRLKQALGSSAPVDPATMQEHAASLESIARMSPPSSPKELAEFLADVSTIIDQINETTLALPEEAKKKWSPEAAWHPQARSALAVKQLGLLEPITEQMLRQEYNLEVSQGRTTQNAWHVVAQKVAGRVLNGVDTALEARAVNQKAETEFSRGTQKVLDSDRAWVEAMLGFEPDVRDQLIARTAEIYGAEPKVSQMTSGKPVEMSQRRAWELTLVQAARTYDKETGTIRLQTSKKGPAEIVPLEHLFAKDDQGNYLWEPPLRGPKGVERKSGKEVALPVVEKPVSPGDEEEAFFHDMEQQETAGFLGQLDAGKQLGGLKAPTELGEPKVPQVHGETRLMEDVAGDLQRAVAETPNLHEKFADLFVRKTKTGLDWEDRTPELTALRKQHMNLIVESLLENFAGTREGTVGPKAKQLMEIVKPRQGRNDYNTFQDMIKGLIGVPGKDDVFPKSLQGLSTFNKRVYQMLSRLVDPKKLEGLMGGPQAAVAPGSTDIVRHPNSDVSVFTNTPKPGDFTSDTIATFRDLFKKHLRGEGWAGTMLDTYTEVATSLVLSKAHLPLDFFALEGRSSGLSMEDQGRGRIAVDIDRTWRKNPVSLVNDMLRVLAHEINHIDQHIINGRIPRPDAMSDGEYQAGQNYKKLAEILQPIERDAILGTMEEAIVPKGYRPHRRDKTGMRYGANDPSEFMAEVSGYIFHSLLGGAESTGPKKAMEVLDWMPEEINQFARGKYRTVADILDGVRTVLQDPLAKQLKFEKALPTSIFLGEAWDAAIQSARNMSKLRDADYIKTQTRDFLSALSPNSAIVLGQPTQATWIHGAAGSEALKAYGVQASVLPQADEVVQQTHSKMFKDPQGVFARWLYPFTNLMVRLERAGVPLARDILHLSQDINPARDRMLSQMRSPFLTKDKLGRFVPDKSGLLLRKMTDEPTGKWRNALNEIRAVQNEKKVEVAGQEATAQQMFEQTPQGLAVKPDFAADWERIRRGLSSEDQQAVMNFSHALDTTFQDSAALLTGELLQSVKRRVSSLLMHMNPNMQYEQALALGAEAIGAFETQNVEPLRAKLAPEQFDSVVSLLGGPQGLYTKWTDTHQHLMSRPGFSSERLPGDYIVEYQNAAGEKKYLGAKHRRHAEAVAKRLEDEGETGIRLTNKKDIEQYTDFDDPSDVLAKFEQVEGKIWDRVATEHEAKFGKAAADSLRAAYVPGEASGREMTTRALEGYLTERKGKVDRSRFDYIDAMTDYTSKLSTSLTYRSVRQQMNMILADPRLKGMPQFEKLVKPHFDQIMAANPRWLGEVRSLMSGYFLGANFSSALIEGTQSATMLVPNLLRMGVGFTDVREQNTASGKVSLSVDRPGTSVIEAWKILGKSVLEAFKFSANPDYTKIARAAEVRDASGSSWSPDETRAWVYDRAQRDGLLESSVIHDPDYGRDQRAADTARFGHGEYGKTTLGELLRDRVYVANQALMKAYNLTSHMNNKIAFVAGAEQAHQMGLRGEAAYRHAQTLKSLTTLSGGKTNAPGIASQFQSPLTRSAWGLASTLQMYGLGAVSTLAELGRESLGRAEGLTLSERRQAQKAFATALTTQVSIGGALSLPFAAASLAFLEQFFGVEAGAAVREGLAGLAGDDEEAGSVIADLFLNGGGSLMSGFDLTSRVGVSNLFGTSSYNGFNAADVFGPGGSIISNAIQGLNMFGQGEPLKAAKSLVPAAFKAPFDTLDTVAKYGDAKVRDQSGSLLYEPTDGALIGSLLGFRPRELSQKRQLQRQLALSQQNFQQRNDRELDGAAQDLTAGNPLPARNLVMDRWASDPTTDRRSLYRSIVDRAANAQIEKDVLAQGSYGNAANQKSLAASYGPGVVSRRSEQEYLRMKLQLGAALGPEAMPDQSAFRKAALVDTLTQEGSTRAEALRLADFLHAGR